MTERRSDYTLQYFLFLLGKLRTCIILSVIFSMCGFPVLTAAAANYFDNGVQSMLAILSVVSLFGISVISFVTPLIAMRHLYSAPYADNILSLPITSSKRYICETTAAIASFAVPFALSLIPTLIIVNFCPIYRWMNIINTSVLALLMLIMFASFNILLTGACGRLTEAIIYPIAMNVVIPFTVSLGINLAWSNVYGASYMSNGFSWEASVLIGVTSPLGCLFSAFMRISGAEVLAPAALIFSAVSLLLGYFLHKRRRANNIGKPFVFRRAFLISSLFISLCFAVCFLAFSETFKSPSALAVLAILLLILMLILEFINYKGVNSIPKFLLKYAGVYAAALLISFGLYYSEGFGETYYVPAAEDILYINADVIVNSNASDGTDTLTAQFAARGGTELADIVTNEQKRIIDNKNTYTYDAGDRIELSYMLKNGRIVSRFYRCRLAPEFLEDTLKSEEYKYSPFNDFDMNYGTVFHAPTMSVFVQNYTSFSKADDVYMPIGLSVSDPYCGDTLIETEITDFPALRAALSADLANDSRFGRHDELPRAELRFGEAHIYQNKININTRYDNGYVIYDSYTNTLEYLKKYIDLPSAEKMLSDAFDKRCVSVTRLHKPDVSQTAATVPNLYRYLVYVPDEAVILNKEQFAETAMHSAGYVELENADDLYILQASLPRNFFNSNGYLDEKIISEMEENNIPDDIIRRSVTFSPKWILLNESYSAELEKLFEENHIFTTPPDNIREREPDNDNFSGTVEPIATTVIEIRKPAETTTMSADAHAYSS